jgi:tetratricopeptide (TPR) repeat protein
MPSRLLTRQHVCVVCALLLGSGLLPAAQSRPPAAQSRPAPARAPADPAARALNLGHYDEVERLLRDRTDPKSVALRARAMIARGRYADAEKLLTPAATAAPTSDAALELGLLEQYVGRRADARRTVERLISQLRATTAADYLRLARAEYAVEEFRDANDAFRAANKLAPDDAAINEAWGEFFYEKGEYGEAQKSFDLALKSDPENVAAMIGLARLATLSNPPKAVEAVQKALSVDMTSVPAHLLAAEMALDDRRRDEARESIKAALDVNPNSLEARSLDAGITFLEDKTDEFKQKTAAVLAINPVYGEVYRVAADQAAANYRFDDAVALVRQALMIDPDNTEAYSDLGMHLLRTGDEPGARQALETAFKRDKYQNNLVTKNLLEMLDTLDTFKTFKDGDLVVRLAPDEAGVMSEQVLPLAKEALARLSQLWDFTPTGPILIEMFPKHDDFAVRNVGLPGMIGALGACFGRVVTLDSPHARPPGEYNWQPTLWHELAHVITIQMSNNRIPRWLTEGISVWEEKRGRPEWGREMEVSFAHAMDQGKVIKLDVLNDGFQDPQLISLAYYEASLLVDHMVERFGEANLRKLLRAYGRGLETDAALKDAYNVTIDDLQKSFDARLAKDYAPLRAALARPKVEAAPASVEEWKKLAAGNPGSFPVQMGLGQALQKAGDSAGAIQAYERAAKLLPLANGDDNPNKAIAAVAIEKGDNARAIQALEAVMKVDHSDVESARKLTSLLGSQGDAARTEDAYRRLVAVDPFDAGAQSRYGRLLLQRKDTGDAVRAFRSALAANPPDRAGAHVDLAEAYVAAGQMAEAKKETLAALEIAPAFERAQDLLLKIVDRSGGGQ